jgi:hypothetical protein
VRVAHGDREEDAEQAHLVKGLDDLRHQLGSPFRFLGVLAHQRFEPPRSIQVLVDPARGGGRHRTGCRVKHPPDTTPALVPHLGVAFVGRRLAGSHGRRYAQPVFLDGVEPLPSELVPDEDTRHGDVPGLRGLGPRRLHVIA